MPTALRSNATTDAGAGLHPPLPDRLVIVVDTREQRPYTLRDSEVCTQQTADYSIKGLQQEIGLERKTKKDLYNSLGVNRDRFERELQRMSKLRYGAIVIEATLDDLLVPPPFSRINPASVIRTLIAWSIRYNVHVYFAGGRANGSGLVRNILEFYWRYRRQGVIGDA
jgi:ERCC4-type nuclease